MAGTGVVVASDRVRPWWRQPAAWVALAVLVAMAVIAGTVVLTLVIEAVTMMRYEPDRQLRPDLAAAGAAWGGFPDTTGLDLVALEHGGLRGERWQLVWTATPGAAERFLAAGSFAKGFTPDCKGATPLPDKKLFVTCETASEDWRRPDGNRISRSVTRGQGADGATLLQLDLQDGF